MITCENCNKENPNGYDFCDDCFSPLIIEAEQKPENDSKGNDYFNLPSGYLFAERYKIHARIGRSGGFGTTYKATDTERGETVSLKLFRRKYINKKSIYTKLEKLMDDLQKLDHKLISNVYDYGISSKIFYATFEYVKGDDLKRHLLKKKKPYTQQEILKIFHQATEALHFLHSHGIVHGDLSPFNIIYCEKEKSIVLIDIGIKRTISEENKSLLKDDYTLGLSLFYTAPEIINGLEQTALSDLYSLGAVMYELATGYVPFKSHSSYRLVTYILNDTPERPTLYSPDIPLFVGEAIMRLLKKNPLDRFHSVEELAEELERGAKKKILAAFLWFAALFAEGALIIFILYLILR